MGKFKTVESALKHYATAAEPEHDALGYITADGQYYKIPSKHHNETANKILLSLGCEDLGELGAGVRLVNEFNVVRINLFYDTLAIEYDRINPRQMDALENFVVLLRQDEKITIDGHSDPSEASLERKFEKYRGRYC